MGDLEGPPAVYFNLPLLSFTSTQLSKVRLPLPVSLFLQNRGCLVITTTRLLGAHCRHSLLEVARQCEADMSGNSVPHQEQTGELETQRLCLPSLYIYSLESNQNIWAHFFLQILSWLETEVEGQNFRIGLMRIA